MKFEIKKVVRALALAEYAEEYKDQTISVWVNPSVDTLRERDRLIGEYGTRLAEIRPLEAEPAEGAEKKRPVDPDLPKKVDVFMEWKASVFDEFFHQWFAALWSHGPETWTADECRDLGLKDPALYQWLKDRSMRMIEEHRAREKKA
jgi:hypothetical protein